MFRAALLLTVLVTTLLQPAYGCGGGVKRYKSSGNIATCDLDNGMTVWSDDGFETGRYWNSRGAQADPADVQACKDFAECCCSVMIIIFGVVFPLLLVLGVTLGIFCCMRRRRHDEEEYYAPPPGTVYYAGPQPHYGYAGPPGGQQHYAIQQQGAAQGGSQA